MDRDPCKQHLKSIIFCFYATLSVVTFFYYIFEMTVRSIKLYLSLNSRFLKYVFCENLVLFLTFLTFKFSAVAFATKPLKTLGLLID